MLASAATPLPLTAGPELFRKVRAKSSQVQGGIMNKRLLAGLATVGIMAGGGSTAALATVGAPAAAASTVTVASRTAKEHECGPLAPLVAKGTITKAQAIAIRNAFVRYVHTHWRSTVDAVLGQQVSNHTITRAQATAVANAITEWVQNHQMHAANHHAMCEHEHMMGGSGKP